MRYFTRGWVNGEYSDEDSEAVYAHYRSRLAAIRPALSPAVSALADADLHDGVVQNIVWNPRGKQLELSLVAGDLQRGYVGIELTYGGATLGSLRVQTLRELGADRRAELLHDEVDVSADGTFQHRMIFWPTHEVTIDFADLSITAEARSDRRLEPGDAFSLADHDE